MSIDYGQWPVIWRWADFFKTLTIVSIRGKYAIDGADQDSGLVKKKFEQIFRQTHNYEEMAIRLMYEGLLRPKELPKTLEDTARFKRVMQGVYGNVEKREVNCLQAETVNGNKVSLELVIPETYDRAAVVERIDAALKRGARVVLTERLGYRLGIEEKEGRVSLSELSLLASDLPKELDYNACYCGRNMLTRRSGI